MGLGSSNACIWRDCSRATGFSQPVHDEVLPGFVDGLRRGLHATYPAPDAHGSALASAPGRHSFASCDSADCPAPRHSRWRAAACHPETSRLFPHSTEFRGKAPTTLRDPLAIGQSYPHLGSAATPTI